MRAFVFPGQGAQTVGMGQDLADSYPAAKAVFEEVDDALGQDLSGLIWNGEIETLTLTANAQPALMATSLAAVRALQVEGLGLETAFFVAGHSLGEYSALAAAGAMSIADTARLLRIRGSAMQEAVPVGIGAMAAILGLDFAAVSAVAAAAAQGDVCQAANDNDPGQVVVSGHKAAVERAVDLAKEAGAKRAVLLPVSAPFHCALMQPGRGPHGAGLGRGGDKRAVSAFDRQCAGQRRLRPRTDPFAFGGAGHRRCALARNYVLFGGRGCDRGLGSWRR
jgi:[acyl-carrier-protein] S-malonyltransferase